MKSTGSKLGSQAPPEYSTNALKIVEQIRTQFGLAED
jgi:hypothetical protein